MRTILKNLPLKCKGYIYRNLETDEDVCILNARLSREQNLKTYQHENLHALNGDIFCSEDVDSIEYRCHKS